HAHHHYSPTTTLFRSQQRSQPNSRTSEANGKLAIGNGFGVSVEAVRDKRGFMVSDLLLQPHGAEEGRRLVGWQQRQHRVETVGKDRKSTRLNSSHQII